MLKIDSIFYFDASSSAFSIDDRPPNEKRIHAYRLPGKWEITTHAKSPLKQKENN
jgi:hypothetical protein